jgi:hypothetical protein
MRRLICAIVLFAAAIVPAAAQRSSEWTTFAPLAGRFTVRTPGGTPIERPMQLQKGMYASHMYSLDLGEQSYTIAYADYNWDVIARKSASTLLADARDGAMKNVKGLVISEREISVNGFPGRDILASVPIGTRTGRARTHMVLAGNRLYILVYVAQLGAFNSYEANSFFRSFYITRTQPAYDWRRFTPPGRAGFNTWQRSDWTVPRTFTAR